MSVASMVSEDVLSGLLAARPIKYGAAETVDVREGTFGFFDPTPELLRESINAVFWASLSGEEGKPALARLEFVDVRGPQCVLEPRAVSVEVLRKLSPLMDEVSNVLYVRKDAKIVGVGSLRGGVSVVAHRPGHLAVLDESIVLGVFEQGNWAIVGGSELNVSQILQKTLPQESFPDRFLKATLIVRLAMAARQTGRGATFILIPPDLRNGISSVSFPVEDFPALPQALNAWRKARVATPSLLAKEQIRKLVNIARVVVAAGAGIDGATLIDSSELRVLGFGAKINAEDDELEVCLIELPKSDVRMIKKKDLGGMRHQTAARLVQFNHDATVITVSQDGPVSLFAWVHNKAKVMAIKHLDRYLVAESGF